MRTQHLFLHGVKGIYVDKAELRMDSEGRIYFARKVNVELEDGIFEITLFGVDDKKIATKKG